ncbi:MAG: ABC transporter permease [Dehalococcoidales bacterium]|jgi:hypothetical protein|nr:ABC transporter permease [Dehalococcoidales bacterium]
MNLERIKALVIKDTSLYFRNRFIALITVLGIIFYIAFYFLMPKTVDETLKIGLFSSIDIPVIPAMETEGLILIPVPSDAELRDGVIDGTYIAGIALPADTPVIPASELFHGLTLYMASDVPEYVKSSITSVLRELAYQAAGQPFTVTINEEIIGDDMLGAQIPPRDRIRPLLAIFLIMFETFGLANLIAEELESGTARALMVTPMSIREFFTGKGIFGIGLAFIQSIVFMAIVGGLSEQPLLIIFGLFLGSLMATAIGFLIGSLARDFMSVLAWGMILFIILLVPAFGIMFPGTVTGWVEYIPSYYLVDLVHRVAGFGAGWGDVWLNIVILAGFSIVALWAGIYGIRRKAL